MNKLPECSIQRRHYLTEVSNQQQLMNVEAADCFFIKAMVGFSCIFLIVIFAL